MLRWKAIYGAKIYIMEVSEDGKIFELAGTTTKSLRNVIDGLTLAQYYSFRVSAVGAAGQGPWSDSYEVLVA